MATMTIGAIVPSKKGAKIKHGLLVRGRDRARVRKLLDALQRVQDRDGRIFPVDDPGSFKGLYILDDKIVPGLEAAAGLLHDRMVDLLATLV